MFLYCLECREKTDSKNLRVVKTKNRRMMVLSNCAVSGSKKLRFVKKQETSEILRNLGLRIYLSKISLVRPILF